MQRQWTHITKTSGHTASTNMNKQIKALKRQAEEYASEYGTKHQVYGQELIDVLDQKFAELIVRECVALVEKQDHGTSDLWVSQWDGACRAVSKDIKQHFGVE
jgi:hypothetical protein